MPSRPGTSERRVVAVVLYELGGAELTPEVDAAVRDVLGDDTRFEALAGGRMVAVLGVERSKGDEAMRAARAGLAVANAIPSARVTVEPKKSAVLTVNTVWSNKKRSGSRDHRIRLYTPTRLAELCADAGLIAIVSPTCGSQSAV